MTDKFSPITPPPELVEQWYETADNASEDVIVGVANRVAQWGADQELEACCEVLRGELKVLRSEFNYSFLVDPLRAARRPKESSLKKQALAELEKVDMLWDTDEFSDSALSALDTIRRALQALPND